MINKVKIIFLLTACIFVGFFLRIEAQILNQSKADSLKNVLERKNTLSPEQEYQLSISIAIFETNSRVKIHYAEKALQLSKANKRQNWEARSKFILGQTYSIIGDFETALKLLVECSKIYERLGRKEGQAAVCFEMGSVFHIQGNYKTALQYYKQATALYADIYDSIGLASSLLNSGEEYRLLNSLDTALYFFEKSLTVYEKIDYEIGVAYTLGNIGLVYAAQNKNDSAEHYINQATEILEELGDRYPIAVYQTYMADIYKDKGDWEKALKYAHNGLQIAEEEGLKEQIRDASLKLSELYRDEGDFTKAYEYQNQYIIYRDSINNEDVIRKMADLRTEYEVSKKQIEVDLLAQRSKTQTIINYGLAIIVLLLVILAVIIYQHSQKRKQVNQVLSDQKEEIEAQRDKLEELVNMKDRFFGIISHDLRSPVNSLQGITQLLAYYVKGRQIDEIEEFVSLADKSINNLSSLLDNLLSWALSQQGSLPYRPEKFQFYYVAEEVRRIFANSAASKKIELSVDVPKELELYADRDSIFAMVRNLVNNAIKFTLERGAVKLTAENGADKAKITIWDTGVGIPQDKIKQLFEFDKGKSTKGTAGEKGSGLGLALCKDIVELNDGEIEVDSQEGKGTKFTIYLPVSEAG